MRIIHTLIINFSLHSKSLAIYDKIHIVFFVCKTKQNKTKLKPMCLNKQDVKDLIKKAKGSLKKDDPSYPILESYIQDVQNMLPDIKGNLNSVQEEIYNKLEVAVGP